MKFIFITLISAINLSFAAENGELKLLTSKLLELACTELSYSHPIEPPEINFRTEDQLQALFCPNEKCSVSAIYFKGEIYLDKSIDIKNKINTSILYHELIHHVQKHQYGATYDCDLWWKKEKEAYALQKKYLKSLNVENDFISTAFLADLKCPE